MEEKIVIDVSTSGGLRIQHSITSSDSSNIHHYAVAVARGYLDAFAKELVSRETSIDVIDGAQPVKPGFSITCSKCSKQAQVAFAPKINRPVLCNDCYGKRV